MCFRLISSLVVIKSQNRKNIQFRLWASFLPESENNFGIDMPLYDFKWQSNLVIFFYNLNSITGKRNRAKKIFLQP